MHKCPSNTGYHRGSILTLTLLSLLQEIAYSGQTCSMQRVKENFYLQFMSTHPRMSLFLKMEIDSTDDMPHCPSINKEPVCVRRPKPYMALNFTSMKNYGRHRKNPIVTCSGFPASRMLQMGKWPIITVCGVLYSECSTILLKFSTCQKKTNTPRMSLANLKKKGVSIFFKDFLIIKCIFWIKNHLIFLQSKNFKIRQWNSRDIGLFSLCGEFQRNCFRFSRQNTARHKGCSKK